MKHFSRNVGFESTKYLRVIGLIKTILPFLIRMGGGDRNIELWSFSAHRIRQLVQLEFYDPFYTIVPLVGLRNHFQSPSGEEPRAPFIIVARYDSMWWLVHNFLTSDLV